MTDDSRPPRPGAVPPWWGQTRQAGQRHPWGSSLAIAAFQVAGTSAANHRHTGRVHVDVLGYLLVLLGPALLVLRHRAPVGVAAGVSAVTLAYVALGYPYGPVFVGLVVAYFAALAAGHRRAVVIVAAVAYAVYLAAAMWLYRWLPPDSDGAESWTEVSGAGAWLLALLAAAELVRVRREQFARLRQERAEAERHRADEERLRIARELHDVLAHSISVINVQAGVALALIDERPEQARAALAVIKSASKEALGEVRQVLGALRTPGAAPRSPAPGLDRLPELTGQAAAAGLAVGIEVDGRRAPLPPGVELAAFRIVQEALTNIVRHSGSRTARVRLTYRPTGLELGIEDDGPATGDSGGGSGTGVIGMRERAAALGGTVEAGPARDGGFRVVAHLPLAHKESR